MPRLIQWFGSVVSARLMTAIASHTFPLAVWESKLCPLSTSAAGSGLIHRAIQPELMVPSDLGSYETPETSTEQAHQQTIRQLREPITPQIPPARVAVGWFADAPGPAFFTPVFMNPRCALFLFYSNNPPHLSMGIQCLVNIFH